MTIIIRCPECEDMQSLDKADFEDDFLGIALPGTPVRVGLVCIKCHTEFILTLSLVQVGQG